MLVVVLATLESTVVATAMPSIIGQLGGMTLYSWAFSAFLLTSTITVPLYGKLADVSGRRSTLFLGVGIFLLGSAACGSAQSMIQLIVFRALQGLGAGAILPVVLTILADLATDPVDLARKQGTISALWGVSSIVGPLLGGMIVDHTSWRWIFYLNLPLGGLALAFLIAFYQEKIMRQKHQLDYLGTTLLTGTVLALLLALLQGGSSWAWDSLPSIGLFVIIIVCSMAFWHVERNAVEPIIPLDLFKNRTIAIATAGSFLLGGMIYGMTTYIPLFVQAVQMRSAVESGLALLPISLSWTAVSLAAAIILKRLGFRRMVQAGALMLLLGGAMMTFFQERTSFAFLLASMAMLGVGFGLANITYTMAAQQTAPKHRRGVATASIQFTKMLGATMSIAVMGSIFNSQIAQHLAALAAQTPSLAQHMQAGTSPATLFLAPGGRSSFPPALLEQLRGTFAQSLWWVFLLMLLMAVASLILVLWFPADRTREKETTFTEENHKIDAFL